MPPPPPTPAVTSSPHSRSPASPRLPPPEDFTGPSTPPLLPSEYLSSPVPDFAATLHTQAADEADAANVSFLRDSLEELNRLASSGPERNNATTLIDPPRDPRRRRGWIARTEHGDPQQQETAEDLSRRDRLQRVLARLNRLHEPPAPTTSAYSNRTPSPHRQSIYDWAPSSAEYRGSRHLAAAAAAAAEEEAGNFFDAILDDLRQQRQRQPDAQHDHPDLLRVFSSSQSQVDGRDLRQAASPSDSADAIRPGNGTPAPPPPRTEEELAERRERLRERERRRRETEWISLRARAAIQRSRQEGSPSATDRMIRYVMERERSGMSEEEERARGAGWLRTDDSISISRNSLLLPPPASNGGDVRNRDRRERVDAFRRGYLPENVPPRLPRISTPTVASSGSAVTPTAPASPGRSSTAFLENALKYLGELRSCASYEDALSTAIDHGFAIKEFFSDKHEDFIMDLSMVDPLPYSSWLQPGTVFEGHQHATNMSCSYQSPHRAGPDGTAMHAVEQINPHFSSRTSVSGTSWGGFDHPPGSTRVGPPPAFDATRPYQFILPTTSSRGSAASSKSASVNPDHDQWPVRVIIHAIDPDRMTLQGTMEAYDVPQHPIPPLSLLNPSSTERPKAGQKHAPITTYLEGHIIDLKTHSFLTPAPPDEQKQMSPHQPPRQHSRSNSRSLPTEISFPAANAQIDAQNWLKLPPFCDLPSPSSTTTTTTTTTTTAPAAATATTTTTTTNTATGAAAADDAARLLLSRARTRALWDEYIFMRWKERCFVHSPEDNCPSDARGGDQDRGHGLTISGFYYVSLRRCDGRVEGLYFDPASTPYQHLRLRGRAGGWPSFETR